ncbi:hypothetical protein FACS1894171_1240 [Clostridia bacterium]|nr:hypothetical protein FACS1894171_1240 [Clostridia bacterium]
MGTAAGTVAGAVANLWNGTTAEAGKNTGGREYVKCPKCGTKHTPGSEICKRCGAEISPNAQRYRMQ